MSESGAKASTLVLPTIGARCRILLYCTIYSTVYCSILYTVLCDCPLHTAHTHTQWRSMMKLTRLVQTSSPSPSLGVLLACRLPLALPVFSLSFFCFCFRFRFPSSCTHCLPYLHTLLLNKCTLLHPSAPIVLPPALSSQPLDSPSPFPNYFYASVYCSLILYSSYTLRTALCTCSPSTLLCTRLISYLSTVSLVSAIVYSVLRCLILQSNLFSFYFSLHVAFVNFSA